MARPEPGRTPTIPPLDAFRGPIKLVDRDGLPEQYHLFDEPSAMAIRAALAAHRPLLVRGEPGVGKTQLAAAAASVLRRPLVQRVVDSRTESRDLLWNFDAVMRLADAQVIGASRSIVGRDEPADASHPKERLEQAREALRDELDVANYIRPGPLWWAFDWKDAASQDDRTRTPHPEHDPETADPANGCVVLIDEIDKADTDVPNGLLEALGSGRFTPQGRPRAVEIAQAPPLVVITTNEERLLPDAFIRRCLVLHLALPTIDQELIDLLVERARVHFQDQAKSSGKLFEDAARKVVEVRAVAKKKSITPLPGQAEFFDLVRAVLDLHSEGGDDPETILESVLPYILSKQEAPEQ